MPGSFRSNVTVGIAVLVGIAGLSYVLAASAAPPGDTTATVEFTPDGKLKRPVGYRKWVYVGEVVPGPIWLTARSVTVYDGAIAPTGTEAEVLLVCRS